MIARRRWTTTAVVALVVAAVAAWAVGGDDAARRRWRPFQAPEVLQIIALGDAAVSANVQAAGDTILVKAPVQLVFRDVDDARAVEVDAPRGRVVLALGGEVTATIAQSGVTLAVGEAHAVWSADDDAWRDAVRVRLEVVDGAARVLVDDVAVAEHPWPGGPPGGRTWVEGRAGSGFDGVACERVGGERREARPDAGGAGGSLRRRVWAAFAAVLVVFGAVAWWTRVTTDARPDPESDGDPVPHVVAGVAALALLAGVWTTLGAQNGERIAAPRGPVASDGWTLPDPVVVERGGPLHVDRRDGDFVFTADVTLAPASALDVLLRGAPLERDRGLVLSISSDERMACGLHRNLGTSWETADGAERPVVAPGRSCRVEVRAVGHRVEARLDDELLGELEDVDLRVGRTAFYALRGHATIESASIEVVGEPGPLDDWLAGERATALGWLVAALLLAAVVGGRDVGAVTWVFPLAAVAWPDASFALRAVATGLVVVLVAAWPGQRRRVTSWIAAGVVVWASWSAFEEAPEPFEPSILNAMNLDDVYGAPVPEAYAWARHPLCRRFNGYVRTQRFREGRADFAGAGDATRIVALGSSSTFGYGVGADETYPALLDRRFGDAAMVLNAGVPGGHAERFVSFVEHVVVDLEPDVLLITLGYNDHIQGGRYDERRHFAAMTTDGIGPLGRLRGAIDLKLRSRAWHRHYRGLDDGEVDPDDVARFETEPAARFGASIEDMVSAARSAGIDVVLVQEPIRPGEDKPVLEAYHDALADVAERTGALLVATQPALDEAGPDVFIDIVHPDARGHRIIAAELAAALTEAGLVEP